MQDASSTTAKQGRQERPLVVAAAFLVIALATIFGEWKNSTYDDHSLLIGTGWAVVAIAFSARYLRSRVSGEWPRFVEWSCTGVNVYILLYVLLS